MKLGYGTVYWPSVHKVEQNKDFAWLNVEQIVWKIFDFLFSIFHALSVQILDCKTITEMCLCVVEIDICDAYL